MKHFRYHVRLIVIAVLVCLVTISGSIALSLHQHHTNIASVTIAVGLFLVIAVISIVEYRRVKFLAGAYHGLTHHESRHLDISSPERFDDTLAVALERKARAAQAPAEPAPLPSSAPTLVAATDWLPDGTDPFARVHPPVSGIAILALVISVLAAVLYLPAGVMGAVLATIAMRAIVRRARRGWWLVIPALLIGLGAFIIGTIRLLPA